MSAVTEIAVRSSILLAVVATVDLLLSWRGATARTRHLMLSGGAFGVCLLPFVFAVLPPAEFHVAPSVAVNSSAPGTTALFTAAAKSSAMAQSGPWARSPGPNPWIAAWYAGSTLMLLWLAAQLAGWRVMAWRATAIDDAEVTVQFRELRRAMNVPRARLRQARHVAGPVCLGLFAPIVLVPTSFAAWPAPSRDIALRHELAHVRRRDEAGNLLTLVVRALYWFNPIAWWIAARAAYLREMACDTLVVDLGCDRYVYAEELVNIARRAPGQSLAPTLGVRSHSEPLHARLRALLAVDGGTPRLSRVRTAIVALALAATVSATAAVTFRPTLTALLELTTAIDPSTRRAALLQLAEDPRSSWFKDVLPLTSDPAPEVRAAAVWALSRIGCHPAFLATTALLVDPDPQVRGAAAASLARFDRDLLDSDQQRFFRRQRAEYRTLLDQWIGTPPPGTARQRLEAARTDPSAWVRTIAEDTLAYHGSP